LESVELSPKNDEGALGYGAFLRIQLGPHVEHIENGFFRTLPYGEGAYVAEPMREGRYNLGVSLVIRKSLAIYRIYMLECLAYPAQMFIWILTDGFMTITMPLVMAAAQGGGFLKGYTVSDTTAYYLAMLCVTSFVTSHFQWEISNEIKDGQFAAQLIRPIGFLHYIFVRNIAWRGFRVILSLILCALLAVLYRGYLGAPHLCFGWQFWLTLLLGHVLSLLFVTAFAMLALFLTDASAIFEMYYFPMLFLSGQVFPIQALPSWAQSVGYIFPFYCTTGVPTEVLVGKMTPSAALPWIGLQLFWIALSYVAFRLMWKHGTQRFTGVGM